MTNWYDHYLSRHFPCHGFSREEAFVDFVAGHLPKGAKILECGSGLGRTAAALASAGYFVLATDNNIRLTNLAADIHRKLVLKGNLAFSLLDIERIPDFFRSQSFDACCHAGVIEHFDDLKRKFLLEKQLLIADEIFCSVPLGTEYTREYFAKGTQMWRELKSEQEWLEEFEEHFHCADTARARQRTDNAFFLLRGRHGSSLSEQR